MFVVVFGLKGGREYTGVLVSGATSRLGEVLIYCARCFVCVLVVVVVVVHRLSSPRERDEGGERGEGACVGVCIVVKQDKCVSLSQYQTSAESVVLCRLKHSNLHYYI